MIEPVTGIMGGVLVAIVSGVIGNSIGNRGSVKDSRCVERRQSCSILLVEKIDNLTIQIKDLKHIVEAKMING
jgi:hypothetical protein